MFNVIVSDRHGIIRLGLRAIIGTDKECRVIAETLGDAEAFTKAYELQPDCVITDTESPEVVKQLAAIAKVFIFTYNRCESHAAKLLKAGAQAYLFKSDSEADIKAALKALRIGKSYFTNTVEELVLAGYINRLKPSDGMTITERQLQIIALLTTGSSSRAVADVLGISVKTAETHRANIMLRTHSHNVQDLVRYAIRNQIIAR